MSATATNHLTNVMGAAGSQASEAPQIARLIAALMDHANSAGVRLNVIERKRARFFSLDKNDREPGASYREVAELKNICAVNIVYSGRPPSVDVYTHPRTGKLIVSRRQGLPISLDGVGYGTGSLENPTIDQFIQYVAKVLWSDLHCSIFREGKLWSGPDSMDHFYERLLSLGANRISELRIDFKPGTRNLNLRRENADGSEDAIYLNTHGGRFGENGSRIDKNRRPDRDDFFEAEYNNYEDAARGVVKRLFGSISLEGSVG